MTGPPSHHRMSVGEKGPVSLRRAELGAGAQEWDGEGTGGLTCIHAGRGDELVQLTPQEVPLLLQVLNALLQP